MTLPTFIDSHCHLNYPPLADNIAEYIAMMQQAHIQYALCVATNYTSINNILTICNNYKHIFGSVGIHPDECSLEDGFEHNTMLAHTTHDAVVAIGETGLDYYQLDHITDVAAYIKLQQQRFVEHIELAIDSNLPLIVHTRNSINDTIDILRAHATPGAVMHCFTEDKQAAKACLDLGCYISISGIVTFKNAHVVHETAKYVPNDRLLIETDAPFLAPHPHRSKTNHPALLTYTAAQVALLRNTTIEQIAAQTSANFFALFQKAQLHL
jgi:TatD DNase family protein